MSKSGADDWRRLGRLLTDRRLELGWPSRGAFGQHIGISGKTIGKLETATALTYSERTLATIERGLGWGRGSIDAILRGEMPTSVDEPPTPARFNRPDLRSLRNNHIHGGTEPTPEELWSAWVELSHEMLVIEVAYASRRGISLDDARNELNETLLARQMRPQPKSWVDPWDRPADEAGKGPGVTYLREAGAAAYEGDPELSDPDDEVHP